MQRRTALKNIGLSFGALTLSSTVVSLFESCQTGTAAWAPEFFTPEQAGFVSKVIDVMLPTTITPGANDLESNAVHGRLYGNMLQGRRTERTFAQMALPIVSKLSPRRTAGKNGSC